MDEGVLLVKVSQNDSLYPKKIPGGQRDQGQGVVQYDHLHIPTSHPYLLSMKWLRMTPLTHPAKKLTRWTARSRTLGSPSFLRRSLSNPNFKKESSQVPRMVPLIHPAKTFDLLVLHIQVLS